MKKFSSLQKVYYGAVFSLTILSVLLLQFPLLNILGFEFSMAVAVLVGYIAGVLLLAESHTQNITSLSQLRRFFFTRFGIGLLIALIPLLLAVSNALLVRTCSVSDGLKFFVLAVVPTVLFSQSLALLLTVLLQKKRVLLFTLIFLLLLLYAFVPPSFSPQLYSFTPLVGLFPGLSYDEALPLLSRLLPYRLIVAAAGIFLVASSFWIWQKKLSILNPESSGSAKKRLLPETFIMALVGPFLLTMFFYSDEIGFSTSEAFLKKKLGATYASQHCTIIYTPGKIQRAAVEDIGRLAEYYYTELCDTLQIPQTERLTIFLYTTPEQKLRFVGTARTDFSKPWLRQIHLTVSNIEHTLKHEMVHVLAGAFGWSPLQVGRSFGVAEGLAVALGDDVWFNEPIDRAAALLLASDTSLEVSHLFTTSGFLSTAPSSSYVLAGSFCKYLITTFGIEHFRKLYSTNNFEAVYHRRIEELITEWKQTLSLYRWEEGDFHKARYYSARTSPLKKECLRTLATMNATARALFAAGDYDAALLKTEEALSLLPAPESFILKTHILFAQKRFRELLHFVSTADSLGIPAASLLPLTLRIGDALWALDSLAGAQQQYEFFARTHLSATFDEACALRLEALSLPLEQHEWMILFTNSLEDTTQLQRLSYLISPLSAYARGCVYERQREYRKAEEEFRRAAGMRSQMLRYFCAYRLGRVLAADRRYSEASTAFQKALTLAPTEGLKQETSSRLKRYIVWSADSEKE